MIAAFLLRIIPIREIREIRGVPIQRFNFGCGSAALSLSVVKNFLSAFRGLTRSFWEFSVWDFFGIWIFPPFLPQDLGTPDATISRMRV